MGGGGAQVQHGVAAARATRPLTAAAVPPLLAVKWMELFVLIVLAADGCLAPARPRRSLDCVGGGKLREQKSVFVQMFEASISIAISLIGAELVLPPANLFLACRCGGNFKGQSHFLFFCFVCFFFQIKVISGLTDSFIMLVGMRIRHNRSQGPKTRG